MRFFTCFIRKAYVVNTYALITIYVPFLKMARKRILKDAKPKTIWIESELEAAAVERAFEAGYNFSEYLARLLVADLNRKVGIAHRNPRRLIGMKG